MKTFFKLLFVTFVLSQIMVMSTARADIWTYDFAGQCSDCNGAVTAKLLLNEVPWQPQSFVFGIGGFISFTYNGSNLLAPFTINYSDLIPTGSVGGAIQNLPGPTNFSITSYNNGLNGFYSYPNGNWAANTINGIADYGTGGSWKLVTSVPEPSEWALMLGGLVLIGFIGTCGSKAGKAA